MSNPFINYLVSEMRGLDLILTLDLHHICNIVAVGSYSMELRQIQEICHEVIPKELRWRIIQSFGYQGFKNLKDPMKKAVVIMALPPNADKDLVEEVMRRGDYTKMVYTYEKNSLWDMVDDVKTQQRGAALGFYETRPDPRCALAWIAYRAFPHTPATRFGLFKLERHLINESKMYEPVQSICDEIAQEIQDQNSEEALLEAIRKLEIYLQPLSDFEDTP